MKFLLAAVNAKYIHTNPAVYSLAAYAKTHAASCHAAVVREYTINRQPGDILAAIYAENPDAVGFSCYIWNWDAIRFLLRELPKVLPEARIFLGGPEVSFHSEKILSEFPGVEAVMIGEGEQTFAELLEALPDGPLEDISGLFPFGKRKSGPMTRNNSSIPPDSQTLQCIKVLKFPRFLCNNCQWKDHGRCDSIKAAQERRPEAQTDRQCKGTDHRKEGEGHEAKKELRK